MIHVTAIHRKKLPKFRIFTPLYHSTTFYINTKNVQMIINIKTVILEHMD